MVGLIMFWIYFIGGFIASFLLLNSSYLEFSKIPYFVKAALLTTEDRNFYEHSGVDLKAIARAFVALVENDGEIRYNQGE